MYLIPSLLIVICSAKSSLKFATENIFKSKVDFIQFIGYSDLITSSVDDNKDEDSQNGITNTEAGDHIRASEHDHSKSPLGFCQKPHCQCQKTRVYMF